MTALPVEVDEAPGARWHYNNCNPLLIGLVRERATGTPVADYASEVLWQPLGAEADASWSADSDASGFPKMESGFDARAVDYARFGHLFAHGGRIGGRQVVPAAWVAEATARDTSADPAEHYQYWWGVDTEREGRFSARGNKGQFVYVDPAADVVVVRWDVGTASRTGPRSCATSRTGSGRPGAEPREPRRPRAPSAPAAAGRPGRTSSSSGGTASSRTYPPGRCSAVRRVTTCSEGSAGTHGTGG